MKCEHANTTTYSMQNTSLSRIVDCDCWELFLQWCLYTVEVTAGVFHKVFHQVFLQLLFILSWKLALRGHFKISKKKKKLRYYLIALSIFRQSYKVHTFTIMTCKLRIWQLLLNQKLTQKVFNRAQLVESLTTSTKIKVLKTMTSLFGLVLGWSHFLNFGLK